MIVTMVATLDNADRMIASVYAGTNGGTAWSRPGSVPASSPTLLVSQYQYQYTTSGMIEDDTDRMGIDTRTYYDDLGRVTKSVQNYTGNPETSNSDVATEYGYDGNDNVVYVQADEPGGAYQKTAYIYGVTTTVGDGVNSNDILSAVQHPDPSTGQPSTSQEDKYLVNALGQTVQYTDRNGNVHQYSYDVLGRLTADNVTTLGAGVDGTIRQITYAYDSQGNNYLITSLNGSGGIVNQVQRVYNGLGQLTGEDQSHSGAVVQGSTPEVQYAYNEMANGENNSRLLSMTYPDGYTIDYTYNPGLDDNISRLSYMADSSVMIESYVYLGLSTVVQRALPFAQNAAVELSYIDQGDANANHDGGDQYTGLDRFGRVIDQNWLNSPANSVDRYQYAYNQDSEVVYRDNLVNAAMSEFYTYDNLGQLASFARGTLNATKTGIDSRTRTQTWTPDALGNFSSVKTNGSTQSNTFNQQNQYTSGGVIYDADGNLTADGTGNSYVYDAWNRLVAVKNGSTMVASYVYDGFNRQVQIIENNSTTDIYYSSQGQAVEEYINGSVSSFSVWSPVYVNALVFRAEVYPKTGTGGNVIRYYALQDANWNITAWVDTSGNIDERYAYDPYGAVTVMAGNWVVEGGTSLGIPYGFQGMRTDWWVGNLNFSRWGRVENPSFGNWMQMDFIGQASGPNGYEAFGNQPTDLVDPSGLEPVDWLTKGQYMWHWHHLLPQAVFNSDRLARHGLNIDVNSAEFGWRLQGLHHVGEGGIHSAGWSKDWETWFKKYEDAGIRVTKEMVLKQLEKMKNMPKYKCILALGKQATRAFRTRAAAKAAAKLAAKAGRSVSKTITKRVGKAIPVIGWFVTLYFWSSDVEAKGLAGGTLNSAIDAVPIVGLVKGVSEIFVGDFIPDLEYDPEVYDADESLPEPQYKNHSGSMTNRFWGRGGYEVLGEDW